jgi:hypothetical protein
MSLRNWKGSDSGSARGQDENDVATREFHGRIPA